MAETALYPKVDPRVWAERYSINLDRDFRCPVCGKKVTPDVPIAVKGYRGLVTSYHGCDPGVEISILREERGALIRACRVLHRSLRECRKDFVALAAARGSGVCADIANAIGKDLAEAEKELGKVSGNGAG